MQKYYVGGTNKVMVGTILKHRSTNHCLAYQNPIVEEILELHRPTWYPSQAHCVFMVDQVKFVTRLLANPLFVFSLHALDKVTSHDIGWLTHIESLINKGHVLTSLSVTDAAENYWTGQPYYGQSQWEYITSKAKVLQVDPFVE